MGHKGTTSSGGVRAVSHGLARQPGYRAHWPLTGKSTIAAICALALVAIVAFGLTREATTTDRASSSVVSPAVATAPKPAFTRPEEAYIQALWPIHGEIERTVARVSLGKILYKTNDLGKAELKARIEASLAMYQRAEAQINTLQPPPSLEPVQDNYRAAIGLFEQAAHEALKMFDDGDDEHLLVAYPPGYEGSNKIREIGVRFWQDEFPAN
jgi:hypothetical protein